MTKLSTDPKERKTYPVGTGALDYFPDALADVAHVSYLATQQHHPGQPMHWDRNKSTDQADCLIRHFLERGTIDSDGVRHSAKMAWRALALLQLEIEKDELARSVPDATGNSHSPKNVEDGHAEQPSHPEVFDRERKVVQPTGYPQANWSR